MGCAGCAGAGTLSAATSGPSQLLTTGLTPCGPWNPRGGGLSALTTSFTSHRIPRWPCTQFRTGTELGARQRAGTNQPQGDGHPDNTDGGDS